MVANIQRYNRLAGIEVSDDVSIGRYLDLNGYIGVSSPEFLKAYASDHGDASAAAPEEAKTYAVREFVEHTIKLANNLPAQKRQIAFGFSDDDLGNLAVMREFIEEELVKEFDNVHFFVFDTSKTKAKVEAL